MGSVNEWDQAEREKEVSSIDDAKAIAALAGPRK